MRNDIEKRILSVIVPVYNAEQYLDQCISSILDQSFSDFYLFLVNDGSTDNSRDICEKFALLDSRVTVWHLPNNGPSTARNFALEKVSTEWVCFVDSDDYVASEFVEKLYNAIQKYKVDISACAYRRVTDDNYSLLVQNKANEIEEYYISADDKWSNVLRNSHSAEGFLWNKMFAKNCLANLQFDENIKMSEDMLFVFHALERVNDIVVVDTPLYFYRSNIESATANKNKSMYEQQIEVAGRIYEIVARNTDKETSCSYKELINNARYDYSKWLAWNRPKNWIQEFQNQKRQWKEENVSKGHNLEEKIYKRSGMLFMIYCFVRSKMSRVKQSINKLR